MTASTSPARAPTPWLEGTTIVAFPARPDGGGGLGHFSAATLAAAARTARDVRAFGPAPSSSLPRGITLESPPGPVVGWRQQYTWRRYLHGPYQHEADRRFGSWLATRLSGSRVDRAYFFTQIARESLLLLQARGIVTILDNPNGHIAHYREAVQREFERWVRWPCWAHPSAGMVARVEDEYRIATVIRVASHWAARAMAARGVDGRKLIVAHPVVDLDRFRPPVGNRLREGPLRLVFVGSLSLGKGFQYLLASMRELGPSNVQLEVVGATGDPWSRRLFEMLARGLRVEAAPGDPAPAYAKAEALVLPTLHDGFGLVVAEAMACGLPVITTDACGAAEWIEAGVTGSVVPAGDQQALTDSLAEALRRRRQLADWGRAARQAAVRHVQAARGSLESAMAENWGPHT